MVFEFDPYAELGVASNSTIDDIRAAFRRAARRMHPDQNRTSPGASFQFQDINAANELLSDPVKRQEYDEYAKIAHSDEDMFFTFRVSTSKRSILTLSETQVIYMLAEVLPDARAVNRQVKEARLNLTLVLDRSNSMSGQRMDKVKAAAHQIIDKLNQDDIFSLVTFNDRADVILEASPVTDKATLKARVSMLMASGGTEIYQGLITGVEQCKKYLAPRLVNHIVFITDGNTYGDEDRSIELAKSVANDGIVISTMGLGQEWNDDFLDKLASATGGSTTYINSIGSVVRFLNDHVRGLANMFAERIYLSVASDPDVKLESAFKLAPSPQPLTVDQATIPLGGLQSNRPISVLLQFELPANLNLGFRSIARLVVGGDILTNKTQKYRVVNDMSLEVTNTLDQEDPPTAILEALGKLTLYRMQENAQIALERGDTKEATRQLEKLATRLFELGEHNLAHQAQSEAHLVAHTNSLSESGRKTLKYDTRYLLGGSEANVE
ncbi:MAG: VWA domain-containing protein [Anaerolineae bacterium]